MRWAIPTAGGRALTAQQARPVQPVMRMPATCELNSCGSTDGCGQKVGSIIGPPTCPARVPAWGCCVGDCDSFHSGASCHTSRSEAEDARALVQA